MRGEASSPCALHRDPEESMPAERRSPLEHPILLSARNSASSTPTRTASASRRNSASSKHGSESHGSSGALSRSVSGSSDCSQQEIDAHWGRMDAGWQLGAQYPCIPDRLSFSVHRDPEHTSRLVNLNDSLCFFTSSLVQGTVDAGKVRPVPYWAGALRL